MNWFMLTEIHKLLSGRNSVLPEFTSEIRDTNLIVKNFGVPEYSKYTFYVETSLDAPVKLTFYPILDAMRTKVYDGTDWVDLSITVPAQEGATRYVINSQLDWLDSIRASNWTVRIKAESVPTAGALTIKVVGGR